MCVLLNRKFDAFNVSSPATMGRVLVLCVEHRGFEPMVELSLPNQVLGVIRTGQELVRSVSG